jgi:nitrogen fixation NifU-like protein
MDHFTHPRNVGELPDANAVGQVGNLKCGDIMKIMMKIENDVIVDVKFQTFGCGAAVATSSMATELVKGHTVQEALQLTNAAVMEALDGLPPVKVHCSVLAEEAIRAALADYYKRQGKDPTPIIGCVGDCDACHERAAEIEHDNNVK